LRRIRDEIMLLVSGCTGGRLGGEVAQRPAEERRMTTSELYRVYCRAYAECERGLGPSARVLVAAGTRIERAVAEFAAHDAANGTPLRSAQGFAQAVATGAEALGPLGLRAA